MICMRMYRALRIRGWPVDFDGIKTDIREGWSSLDSISSPIMWIAWGD